MPSQEDRSAVGESLVVSGVIAPLAPTNQLQSLVEVEAVTGGESRPCPPRKTAVAVGESLVVPDGIAPLGPRKSTSIPGCSAGCDWRRVAAWRSQGPG